MAKIACDHPRLSTEQNPIAETKTIRCSRCGDILLSMTFEEMSSDAKNPMLLALLKRIRKQHLGSDS